jgi:hypothetical protein
VNAVLSVSTEDCVEAYLAIRAERDRIRKEYEANDDALKTDMTELERLLLSVCNDIGANSINTKHGTVIRSIKERFVCNDWDNFKPFILENGLIDCLEKRIHQKNFGAFMAEQGDVGLPPGVNVMREFDITVRKSSK